jgi:hypothetical protein
MTNTKNTKRIQVTLDITIPADWTLGETEVWIYKRLRTTYVSHGWRTDAEVGEQRMKPPASGRVHGSENDRGMKRGA